MMLWLLTAAWAEPTALRAPGKEPVTIVGEDTRASVATWIENVGIAVTYGWRAHALELSAGTKGTLADLGNNWTLQGQVAGSLITPFAEPNFGIGLSPSLGFSFTPSKFRMDLNLVSPMAVSFVGGVQSRLPVLGEGWWVWELGDGSTRTYLGFGGRVGAAFHPSEATSIVFEGAVVLQFGPARDPSAP